MSLLKSHMPNQDQQKDGSVAHNSAESNGGHERKTSNASASLDPIVQPNGSIMLLPFPSIVEEQNVRDTDQDELNEPDIEWPQPIIPQGTGLRRTKSFITLATTISGVGKLQIGTSVAPTFQTLAQNLQQQTPLSPEDYPEIDYLQLILQASTRIYDLAAETPCTFARNLSAKVGRGNKIFLKREDMQPGCFSFKVRGAYNRISLLSKAEKRRGVICMSAGNHAQGVALAARHLNIKATIVMPTSASEIKVTSVRRLGATVVLSGSDLEEAKKECLRLAQENGYVFIPPFDDPYVIAGQGTCGMEILRQIRKEKIDAIFVPVGGGGLLAGIAAYVKRVQPNVRIIGVNTMDSAGLTQSLINGKLTVMDKVGLFSDGTAVRQVGQETFRICHNLVDDMILVSTDEICAAIKDVFDDTRSILEPSGALSVAGVKKFLAERGSGIKNGVFVAATSGANMNFDRLRFVCERSRIGEGKECLLSVKVEERPGSFMKLYELIYPRSVTELSYRFSDEKEAHIYIAFELLKSNSLSELHQVVSKINNQENMAAINITDNDMAKSHLRFLVGGRARLSREKLYRFFFPERQGALKTFFDTMNKVKTNNYTSWNLTLVHYRNTGGDQARVLVGLNVPNWDEDQGLLAKFLAELNYPYTEETQNEVYDHFLR
ncbi:hypothetical protein MIR68_007380 [Amoeboaphelidium protococcarum]|nr:hypothetical protein MIR68_007380 [Amoeboaphelidium protococcarum]